MRRRGTLLWAGGGLVLAAVFIAALRIGALQGDVGAGSQHDTPAPELRGIAGWLNSKPLSVKALRGKVVLVDFWTYSCVNCVRTIPALRALYARYEPSGLQILGIHSPEFSFEKVRRNVEEAVSRYRVRWPVALDNHMATWDAFRNRFWPHVYLIDAKGRLRFDRVGEGGDDQIQTELRKLIRESGRAVPPPIDFSEPLFSPHLTAEIYAGYERGGLQHSLGNPEGYVPERSVTYAAPAPTLVDEAGTTGTFFLAGRWRNRAENVQSESPNARVVLPFFAKNVFLVGAGSARLRVLLDGKPIAARSAGADVSGGVMRVRGPRLYGVAALPRAGAHVLTLIGEPGFRLYTFTFG
jgi:thiol-disulfide isomerase/thioredoxin